MSSLEENPQKIKSTVVPINKDNFLYSFGVENMVYKTDVNSFVKDSGVTIQNVDLSNNLQGYYLSLKEVSDVFECGNVLENLFLSIKTKVDNSILVVDFAGVQSVSDNFWKAYTKILLESSNKIISINMSLELNNTFSPFIEESIIKIEE